ncbi:MAG: hypothetical protein GXO92_00470 [FCB group bacterium]|nr:hypothetical protein [FCB group bacterium]
MRKTAGGLLIIIMMVATIVGAQESPPREPRSSDRAGKMEMMAIWRLTDDLQLTEKQAEIFFPRLREHREKMREIEKRQQEIMKPLLEKIDKGKEITEREFKSSLKSINELSKKKIDMKADFLLSMGDILSPVQQVKLAVFQEQFKREIIKRMKDYRSPHPERRGPKRRNIW